MNWFDKLAYDSWMKLNFNYWQLINLNQWAWTLEDFLNQIEQVTSMKGELFWEGQVITATNITVETITLVEMVSLLVNLPNVRWRKRKVRFHCKFKKYRITLAVKERVVDVVVWQRKVGMNIIGKMIPRK